MGSNRGAALLSLTLGARVGAWVGARVGAWVGAWVGARVGDAARTALGIFFRFQVTDFDVFCLFLVSHFVIYPLLGC